MSGLNFYNKKEDFEAEQGESAKINVVTTIDAIATGDIYHLMLLFYGGDEILHGEGLKTQNL